MNSLSLGKVSLPVKLVTDNVGIYGVFRKSLHDYEFNYMDVIKKNCERYKWKDAKLKYLNKLGRPYYWTVVYFGEREPYSYRYLFLMRMVDCVAKLSHCSRKFALKHGGFYKSVENGILIFTVNWEIFGALAPRTEVVPYE